MSVCILNDLKEEFFFISNTTTVSSLVNLNIVGQLKVQAATLNVASFVRYD